MHTEEFLLIPLQVYATDQPQISQLTYLPTYLPTYVHTCMHAYIHIDK